MDTLLSNGATNGANAGHNGAAVATNAAPAVATPDSNAEQRRPAVAPPLPWCRVSDLARELQRDPRRLRELVAVDVPEADQRRIPRAGGGRPELWVSPAAAALLRARLTTPVATAPPTADTTPHNGAAVATNAGSAVATPDSNAEQRRTAVDPAVAPTPDAAAGWRELVAEVRSESDRLRAELAVTRERLDQLERRAGEAERGRLEAVARVEALRAAWWRWYALAQARPWWRRRLPDAPAELTAGPALPPPQR